jgi:hypothetical protein
VFIADVTDESIYQTEDVLIVKPWSARKPRTPAQPITPGQPVSSLYGAHSSTIEASAGLSAPGITGGLTSPV